MTSRICRPLDEVTVEGNGKWAYRDGAGRVVAKETDSEGTIRVLAKGTPGAQQIRSQSGAIPMRLNAETSLETGSGELDHLVPRIRFFLANDTTTYYINGRVVHGYRSPDTSPIWLRDHAHQMKGFKYFDPEVVSAIDYFLEEQKDDGSLWDYVVVEKDPETPFGRRQPHHARCEVEADVEYLAVEAAFRAWQCTGDDAWAARRLPQLEKAILYTMSDPWRWSEEHRLVKRPYTVDTWDYEYQNSRPYVKENSRFGIMHGDNSGLYAALLQLAILTEQLGDAVKAAGYRESAVALRERANKLLWNRRYYLHWYPLQSVAVKGVDVRKQLSLSNPYDINRGLPTHKMALAIIREYQRRREAQRETCFAEWHSIDPPFPTDSFETEEYAWTKYAGHYTNGGILPLVGGELARAAFEHGEEAYGIDILRRYSAMVAESGETYLWYHRDGRPGKSADSTLPTDGWGSAAMLYALMEGLAGVVDDRCLFNEATVSPRWAAAGEREARVVVRYPASEACLAYRMTADRNWDEINLELSGSGEKIRVRLLMPAGREPQSLIIDGKRRAFRARKVEDSLYAEFSAPANASVQVRLR